MRIVVPPSERTCERCGRVARWDETAGTWAAGAVDDQPCRGDPHCVHEWDITGTYSPIDGE